MTIHTIEPRNHLTVKSVSLGLAGVAIAVGAAFGVTNMLAADGSTTAPVQEPRVTITDGARDSWEGRIGPDAKPGTEHGVRDSWMPPGTTDRELGRS